MEKSWFYSLLVLLLSSAVQAQSPVSAAESGDGSPFSPVTFGDGIEFSMPHDQFHMNLRFRMQNLAAFEFPDDNQNASEDALMDWQVRRLRLRMNGFVISQKLRYLLQLSFSRGDQDWDNSGFPNVVRDAMVMYQVTPSWQLGFGQGKLPGNRQRVISSGDQQFTDRSIVNAAFNIDRDFGVQSQWTLRSGEDVFRWKAAISSGEGRNRSVEPDGKLFYTSRLEWLPLGDFLRNGEFFESDLVFEKNLKWAIGITSAFLDGAARSNGPVGKIFTTTGAFGDPVVRRSQWVHYFDTLFKWQGHSLYLEWVQRESDRPVLNTQQAVLIGQGYNIQLGKMLTTQTELALRHSAILPERDVVGYYGRVREWTVGVNHFLNGHRVKLQANVGRTEGVQHFARFQIELGI